MVLKTIAWAIFLFVTIVALGLFIWITSKLPSAKSKEERDFLKHLQLQAQIYWSTFLILTWLAL